MITELLRPEKIVTGLSGGLAQALEQLFTRSSFPDRVNEYRTALIGGNSKLYTYVDDEIAVPHVRIEGLPGTDMILGLARKGVRFNGHSIKILFLSCHSRRADRRALSAYCSNCCFAICFSIPRFRRFILSLRCRGMFTFSPFMARRSC